MILRLLNPQGIAGIAVSGCLALLLILQRADTRHWKSETIRLEQLYAEQKAALAATAANIRAATEAARAADARAAEKVQSEQRAINERTLNDYENRLAAARARAERLRVEAGSLAANPGAGGAAPVSTLPAATDIADQAAREGRLPPADALTATEQAIQLDELIKWVTRQAKVDNDPRL